MVEGRVVAGEEVREVVKRAGVRMGWARDSIVEVCSRVLIMSNLHSLHQLPLHRMTEMTTNGYGTTALRLPAIPPANKILATSALLIFPSVIICDIGGIVGVSFVLSIAGNETREVG